MGKLLVLCEVLPKLPENLANFSLQSTVIKYVIDLMLVCANSHITHTGVSTPNRLYNKYMYTLSTGPPAY